MAEQSPEVRNKGMLLVAFVLAALVVVIYNVQISRAREEARGETVLVLRFARNIKRGEQLDVKKDVVVQEMRKDFQTGLGSVVVLNNEEEKSSVDGAYVNRKINKGEWLMWAHISHEARPRASEDIRKRHVAYTLEVDAVPGELLSIGDKVNLIGRIALKGKSLKSYRIIAGVTVLAVGGQGVRKTPLSGKRTRVSAKGQRSYRSITIEIRPDESLVLNDVLSNVVDGVTVELLNPDEATGKSATVNPVLRNMPAASRRLGGRGSL